MHAIAIATMEGVAERDGEKGSFVVDGIVVVVATSSTGRRFRSSSLLFRRFGPFLPQSLHLHLQIRQRPIGDVIRIKPKGFATFFVPATNDSMKILRMVIENAIAVGTIVNRHIIIIIITANNEPRRRNTLHSPLLRRSIHTHLPPIPRQHG